MTDRYRDRRSFLPGLTDAEVRWRTKAREHPELVRSVAIGLGILECFNGKQNVLDHARLTAMLDIEDPSTLRRFTSVLVADGYLEQTPTQGYRLAARAGDVALAILDSMVLPRLARRPMRRIRERTGYTVSLVALNGTEAVYLDRLAGHRRGQHEIDDGIGVGARLPAHRTAAGKVLIAHLPPAKRRDLLARLALQRRASSDVLKTGVLRSELKGVLMTGFALSDGEVREGMRSVAAPVVGEGGVVVAALEISVPASAVSLESLTESFSPQLRSEGLMINVPDEDLPGLTG